MTLVQNHLQLLNGNKFMREFKIIIILFFVMIATSCGQQKKYISYTVKKGETIKGIAKRLGIKTKDLLILNPDIGRKPVPETLIIIPNNEYQQIEKTAIPVENNNSIIVSEEIPDKEEPVPPLLQRYVYVPIPPEAARLNLQFGKLNIVFIFKNLFF